MSYISGLSSIVKGERGEFFFNKDQFLFATNFATNPYFADELNWSKIAVYYKDLTSNQRQIIILKDDNGRGWFCPSEMARTGAWSVDRIEVYDKQGDSFTVSRANIPSPEEFDVSVQRIVAPSPSVATVVINPEKIVNGTFDTDISGWIALAGAQWWSPGYGQQAASSGVSERGFLQSFSTVSGRKYEYSVQIPSGSNAADIVVGNGTHNTVAGAWASRLVERIAVPVSTITGQFEATSSGVTLSMMSNSSGLAAAFDNVSFKEIPDTIELAAGASEGFEVGFKAKLWDDVAGAFLSSDVYEITEITKQETKDIVKFDKQIIGAYAGKTLRLRFPSYSEVSGKQSALFQYVGSGY